MTTTMPTNSAKLRKRRGLRPVAAPSEKLAYSIAEASAVGSIGLTNLRRLVKSGAISSVRVGRKYLIPRAELLRFLERTSAA
jgi:excisionase family DNA binding protein